MNLYLHIGTEKTGSSYLQSMAAINRSALQEKGTWFPYAGKHEFQLQQGQISAGNAQPLTDSLHRNNELTIRNILTKHWKDAEDRRCQSVMLSNELLVLALADDGRVQLLETIASEVGFTKIRCLLLLRDPIDQALSLYKHRAKSGTALPIEEWPTTNYHYGSGLYRFLTAIEGSNIKLTCKKYDQRIGHLEKIFFKEWLGIADTLTEPKQEVNPSLSISELLLISHLRLQDTLLPEFLYQRFLGLLKKEKAKEPRITAYYQAILSNHLAQFATTWQLCNQWLPVDEQLKVPSQDSANAGVEEKVMTFSQQQGELLAFFMKELQTPSFKIRITITKWRRKLGNWRNQLMGR